MVDNIESVARDLYGVHKEEASNVVAAHQELYRAYFSTFVESPPTDNAAADLALQRRDDRVSTLQFFHMGLALGLRRNRRNFRAREGDYMQEAYDDATTAGYHPQGWNL